MSRKKITITKNSLGERFYLIRTKLNLTQKQFATCLNTSASYISEIESNKTAPGLQILYSLNRNYSINLNWLLTGEGEMLRGQEAVAGQGQAPQQQAQPGGIFDKNPEVMDLLEDARYVLSSGNFFAYSALERNIKYFRHAVAVEKELDLLKQQMTALVEKVSALEKALKPPESAPDHGEGDGGAAVEKKAM